LEKYKYIYHPIKVIGTIYKIKNKTAYPTTTYTSYNI